MNNWEGCNKMRSWNSITLGEVLPFKYGKNLPASKRTHSGEYDVVSSAGIIDSHDTAFTTEPCIVIGRKGSIGSLTYCPDPVWPTDTTFYVTGTPYCDLRFGYYVLQTLPLNQMNNDSAVPGLNRNDAESLAFSLPPVSEQKTIAKVLGSLDDKIAANQRTIQSADSLRNALWDKLLKTNTESLPLSSLAEFINGRAFTKNATGTGRVVARIAELNSGIGSNTVFNDIEVHQNHVVLPGELLFAWSGTLMTKRWPYDEAIVNQHIFKVLPISKFDLWALELIIQSQIHYFQMIAAGKATTMGHIKRADLDKTVEVPTSIPDKLNMLGKTLWMLASQAEQENQTLARTRDELLPLLMSGKITVRDAEEASAEVGVDKHEVKE
ncbi:restriction endonuclease subunit S [Corynebacterium matruchotii]|uniref:restriction endonuclease subunit S n=1 Tax=Corynebacterium matruchotii TaxID=43768 RepID=UPI0028ED90CB|nr:restriction endonuclease subunit S [Corynebacterium matruchotii]